jgi:hypothetical protein
MPAGRVPARSPAVGRRRKPRPWRLPEPVLQAAAGAGARLRFECGSVWYWYDGPTVTELAAALEPAGVRVAEATLWSVSVPAQKATKPAGQVLLSREVRTRTTALAFLRDPAVTDVRIYSAGYPPGGDTPRSPVEEIAVTLLFDAVTDLQTRWRYPDPGSMPDGVAADVLLNSLEQAAADRGGVAAILDTAATLAQRP